MFTLTKCRKYSRKPLNLWEMTIEWGNKKHLMIWSNWQKYLFYDIKISRIIEKHAHKLIKNENLLNICKKNLQISQKYVWLSETKRKRF